MNKGLMGFIVSIVLLAFVYMIFETFIGQSVNLLGVAVVVVAFSMAYGIVYCIKGYIQKK